MLTATLNGFVIPVPADFSMQLTWKSPVCDFEKIPGGYGLGISFPENEYTRPIFGNSERFSKSRGGKDQHFPSFEIRFSGVLLMSGTLKITGVFKKSYECSLIDQVGVLGEKEQERDILDIPVFSKIMNWEQSSNYNPMDHPYCCFPVLNPSFFNEKGLTVKRASFANVPGKGLIEDGDYDIEVMSYLFQKTAGRYVNQQLDGKVQMEPSQIDLSVTTEKGNTYQTGRATVVSPFFFLNYVIRESLKDNNFQITENFLDQDHQLKNMCIYNNYDITTTRYLQSGEISYIESPYRIDSNGNYIYEFPQGMASSAGLKVYSYVREYFRIVIDQDHLPVMGNLFTPKNHLPRMKVGDLILSTQNLANVCFHFLPDNTVRIHSREHILKGEVTDLDPYILGEWQIGQQKSVALKFTREHDPQDLVFAERFNDLSDRRADIKAPVADWSGLWAIQNPIEGEIRLMSSNNTYYEYRWITQEKVEGQTMASDTTDVMGWEEISIGLQNGWYCFGREEVEEIKTTWSACYGNEQLTLVSQQGNMNSWKARQQAFTPRLMISGPNNTGGSQHPGFSFEYENQGNGLLPVYWKEWNQFWANRLAVSAEFDFPVNVLRHLIYNICQKYRTREGEFLIEEMSCELFVDRIGTTEIKGFKV